MTLEFSGVFLTVKNHGGMYTVCTEGELFYAPMYRDGSVNLEEFDIVDFWDSEVDAEELDEIQSALIDMMQRAGLYFKQPLTCLLYTSPSPRDLSTSRMPSSA